MPIETKVEGGAAVVVLAGRLTLGREIERLETAVRDLLAQGHRRFIFDVTALDYLDSSGIGAVVASLTDAKKAGGDLRLAGANERLRKLFRLTGVDSLVSMYPTTADAAS